MDIYNAWPIYNVCDSNLSDLRTRFVENSLRPRIETAHIWFNKSISDVNTGQQTTATAFDRCSGNLAAVPVYALRDSSAYYRPPVKIFIYTKNTPRWM
jgi:hypothetical protein